MQIFIFLLVILFPFSMVLGFVCFVKGIYFFVKAVQNTTSTAFDSFHTKITPVNVIWYPNCLTSVGKSYRLKSFKYMVWVCFWWGGIVGLAQLIEVNS